MIDKLLRLPLRFFEKRQVGELSQRLSELGNLRGFLTGTAITSLLDLMFATIYILIMIMYSPLLTAVALGTIPVYIDDSFYSTRLQKVDKKSSEVYGKDTESSHRDPKRNSDC